MFLSDEQHKSMQKEQWERAVRGTCRGLSDDEIAEVIRRMMAAEPNTTCIWHEAAAVTKTECYCQMCRPDIKRYI